MTDDQKRLLERGIVVLPEEITHDAYGLLLDALDQMTSTTVRLYCRGNGGCSSSALAMADLIAQHGDVVGMLPGLAASSHATVWAACQRRFVYPHGCLGLHKVSWDGISTRADSLSLRLYAEQWARTERAVAGLLGAAGCPSSSDWYDRIQQAGSAGIVIVDALELVELQMARPVAEWEEVSA